MRPAVEMKCGGGIITPERECMSIICLHVCPILCVVRSLVVWASQPIICERVLIICVGMRIICACMRGTLLLASTHRPRQSRMFSSTSAEKVDTHTLRTLLRARAHTQTHTHLLHAHCPHDMHTHIRQAKTHMPALHSFEKVT